jgi:hypothetical protein
MMATEFLKQKKEQLGKELDVLKEEQKGYTRVSMLVPTKAGAWKLQMFLEMAINVTVLIEQKEAEIAVIDELIDEAEGLDELNAVTVILDPDGFRCETEIVNVYMECDEYLTQMAIHVPSPGFPSCLKYPMSTKARSK